MKIESGKFRVAVKDTFGVKSQIAKNLGCSRKTLYDWLHWHPEALELIQEEEERLIDKAEVNLSEALDKKDWKATEFVLKTKGRKRGFIERPEIQIIDKQNNLQITNESTYKFVIEKPNNARTQMETEQETTTSI